MGEFLAHYSQYKHTDVFEMDNGLYLSLLEAMRVVKSRQSLRDLEVSAYPHTKDRARQKTHKKLYTQAFPQVKESRVLTMGDLQKSLKGVL